MLDTSESVAHVIETSCDKRRRAEAQADDNEQEEKESLLCFPTIMCESARGALNVG